MCTGEGQSEAKTRILNLDYRNNCAIIEIGELSGKTGLNFIFDIMSLRCTVRVSGHHIGTWTLEETTQFHFQPDFLAHGPSAIWLDFVCV